MIGFKDGDLCIRGKPPPESLHRDAGPRPAAVREPVLDDHVPTLRPDPGSRRPTRTKALLLLIFMGTVSVCAAEPAQPPTPFGRAYLPASTDQVLQLVPSESDPAVRQLKLLRAARDREPTSAAANLALARAYVSFAQRVGDAHYAGYADAIIAPSIAVLHPRADELVVQATILQYRHQFADARRVLQAALKVDPRNPQAWMTLATLDMVQGDFPAAGAGCAHLAGAGGFDLGVACSAALRSFIGHAEQSIALLERLETDSAAEPGAFKAWVEGLLAECEERLGHWPVAESHYRRALALAPRDNYLRVSYADFLLDRQRPREVLALLSDDPNSDTAFLRIALAEKALGDTNAARDAWLMAARFEALSQRGAEFFGREQVRFALLIQGDANSALELAERNFKVQRAPWDIRVLLEAARAADRPEAAGAALRFVAETHLQDPVIEALAVDLRGRLATRIAGAR